MTAEQIISRLKEFFGDSESGIYSYAMDDFMEAESFDNSAYSDMDWKEKEVECFKQLGLGEIKEVAHYGGEGQGETWYTVKHFVDHDIYIRTNGFYTSYNGTDFYDGWGEEVRPQKVEVLQYHIVKK